ncbi:hypothetical protein ACSBR1_035137 [Camellia fascicularis]
MQRERERDGVAMVGSSTAIGDHSRNALHNGKCSVLHPQSRSRPTEARRQRCVGRRYGETGQEAHREVCFVPKLVPTSARRQRYVGGRYRQTGQEAHREVCFVPKLVPTSARRQRYVGRRYGETGQEAHREVCFVPKLVPTSAEARRQRCVGRRYGETGQEAHREVCFVPKLVPTSAEARQQRCVGRRYGETGQEAHREVCFVPKLVPTSARRQRYVGRRYGETGQEAHREVCFVPKLVPTSDRKGVNSMVNLRNKVSTLGARKSNMHSDREEIPQQLLDLLDCDNTNLFVGNAYWVISLPMAATRIENELPFNAIKLNSTTRLVVTQVYAKLALRNAKGPSCHSRHYILVAGIVIVGDDFLEDMRFCVPESESCKKRDS